MSNDTFDEKAYLEANSDVAEAVKAGSFVSGWDHYQKAGRAAGRPLKPANAMKDVGYKFGNRQVFFCHIPKTAGTTLRTALESAFNPHQILPDDRMLQRAGGNYPKIDITLSTLKHAGERVRLVRGHYHLAFREFLRDPITIAVLRSPKERVISHLKHIIGWGGQTVEGVLGTLDKGVLPVPENLMVRYLGGSLNHDGVPYYLQNRALLKDDFSDVKERLNSAKENLETIQVLGITEDLAKLRTAVEDMGFTFNSSKKLNTAVADLPLKDSHLQLIEEKSALDQELYTAAKKILKSRKGKVSI